MSDDNTILVTKSREDATALRKALMEEFRELRPWPCVVVSPSGDEFRVTIDGPWGSRLPKDEEAQIKSFAKKFQTPPVSEKN